MMQKDWSDACRASVGARFYEEAGFVETRATVSLVPTTTFVATLWILVLLV